MSDTPTVTLSMFWPLLMQAAGNEYNSNAQTALARIEAKTELPANHLSLEAMVESLEAMVEEMAREHFPSGSTSNVLGFYAANDSWVDEEGLYDTFDEMIDAQDDDGALSPKDPAHVAMVVRILAISQSLPVYVEGPNVTTRHYDKWLVEDGENIGPGILLSLERTRPARSSAGPVSVGYFFSYRPGEFAENFDVADALFRWMVERHAEIVKAAQAEDAAESAKDTAPTPANVLKFKAT